MCGADREALGRMAYAVLRRHQLYSMRWEALSDEYRAALRDTAEHIYNQGRMYERTCREEAE